MLSQTLLASGSTPFRTGATADLADPTEARLTPVERGRLASAADVEVALRSGGPGRSPEDAKAIGEAFRRDLDRAPTSLPASAGPARQAAYAELRRAGEFALLASDVYSDASDPALLPRGYTALSDTQAQRQFPGFTARDDRSGFYSRVYHDRPSNTYVVVNRGTDDAWAPVGVLRQTPDGKTNGDLIAGNTTRQANLAIANARQVVAGSSNNEVRFAGHSLGGALASLQAISMRKGAVVFNPLGINARTAEQYGLKLDRLNALVHSYQVSGEPVATANRALGLRTTSQTTMLASREIGWSANDGFRSNAGAADPHSMVAVIAGVLDGMVAAKSGGR